MWHESIFFQLVQYTHWQLKAVMICYPILFGQRRRFCISFERYDRAHTNTKYNMIFGPNLSLVMHLLILAGDDSALVDAANGQPLRLPSFVFDKGKDFPDVAVEFLHGFELMAGDLLPTFVLPQRDDQMVHVLMLTARSAGTIPSGFKFMPLRRIMASHLPQVQASLLKKHLKTHQSK